MLEWGSRGREFESRHSDHNSHRNASFCGCYFFARLELDRPSRVGSPKAETRGT